MASARVFMVVREPDGSEGTYETTTGLQDRLALTTRYPNMPLQPKNMTEVVQFEARMYHVVAQRLGASPPDETLESFIGRLIDSDMAEATSPLSSSRSSGADSGSLPSDPDSPS